MRTSDVDISQEGFRMATNKRWDTGMPVAFLGFQRKVMENDVPMPQTLF